MKIVTQEPNAEPQGELEKRAMAALRPILRSGYAAERALLGMRPLQAYEVEQLLKEVPEMKDLLLDFKPERPNTLLDEEQLTLILCGSEEEWNALCDEVKLHRGDRYPDDWFARMVLSGLAAETQRNWSVR